MAAPHITGALALLKARFPADSPRQLINRLLRSVDRPATLAGKSQTNGRLNLARALTSTDNRPFNDDFASRAVLTSDNITARAANPGATRESDEPLPAGLTNGSGSLWWQWSTTVGGTVSISTTADTTFFAVFKRPDGQRTYLSYLVSPESRTVTFSDGHTMLVQPRVLAKSTRAAALN
jgi:subtilisin family serine protease